MKKLFPQLIQIAVIGAVVSLGTLGGWHIASAEKPPSNELDQMVSSQDHTINITSFKFVEAELIVKPGDTITWTNNDIVPHTATALDRSWDTGSLSKGESFTLTVTEGMSLDYFCLFHRNMTAKLILNENG